MAIEEADNRIYLVNQDRNHIYSYDLNGNFHEDETIHLADGQEFERPYIFADKKKESGYYLQSNKKKENFNKIKENC